MLKRLRESSGQSLFYFILFIAIFITSVAFYNNTKDLPKNTSVAGTDHMVPASSVRFLSDETYLDTEGNRQTDQEIFDQVISMIKEAKTYILIDMFLFNDFQGKSLEETRALSSELTEALVSKKKNNENISITLITDPINTIYGSHNPENLKSLRDAQIDVIVTDVDRLRDSNPIYSTLWRVFFQWLPVSNIKFGNPFSDTGDSVSLKSYFRLLNFKANHRKVMVADYMSPVGLKMRTFVTSANPHDGSSAHGNVALVVDDSIWEDVLTTEMAVAEFSNSKISPPLPDYADSEGDVSVSLLTEMEILNRILDSIDSTGDGDSVDMAMFYLSDRKIIKSLKSAYQRGVSIRLILDPNKDAFGREKSGIPNRSVAHELMAHSEKYPDGDLNIKWCDTHGEQCHSKLVLVKNKTEYEMFIGSANMTKRNIGDYNLETDFVIRGNLSVPAISDANSYFERLWSNMNGKIYTTDYESYEDSSIYKTVKYRIMEKTGMSSF